MRYLLIITLITFLVTSCEYRTIRLDNYPVQGIDVSHYQSRINWDTVANQNIQFAFVKATEGATFNDSIFCHNWDEIRRVGLKRGAYHFFRPTIPATIQANNFIRAVNMEYGDLPPVLDVEVMEGVSKKALLSSLKEWIRLIEFEYQIRPIIYTNVRFYNKYLAGHFPDYPLWIARYNNRHPRLADGKDWHFWQYGNRGQLKGIYGDVDFNVFYGHLLQLEALCLAPNAMLSAPAGQPAPLIANDQ